MKNEGVSGNLIFETDSTFSTWTNETAHENHKQAK